MHQTKPLLALFVEYNCEPLQVDYTGPFAKLSEERVDGINKGFGVDLALYGLVESKDGVSY